MKKPNLRLFFALLTAIMLLAGYTAAAMAAHPNGNFDAAQINAVLNNVGGAYYYWNGAIANVGDSLDILLKDSTGAAITALDNAKAYSPKQTCGKCHQYENAGGILGTSISKSSVLDGVTHSYTVKGATSGVSSGYHFSQGLNETWSATERGYYGMPSFTSSPGMLGKF